jgi:hypothetical protein
MSRRFEQGETFPVGQEFQIALDRPTVDFAQVSVGQRVEVVYRYRSMSDEENSGRLIVDSIQSPQQGEPGYGYIHGSLSGRLLSDRNEPTDKHVTITVSIMNARIHSI